MKKGEERGRSDYFLTATTVLISRSSACLPWEFDAVFGRDLFTESIVSDGTVVSGQSGSDLRNLNTGTTDENCTATATAGGELYVKIDGSKAVEGSYFILKAGT